MEKVIRGYHHGHGLAKELTQRILGLGVDLGQAEIMALRAAWCPAIAFHSWVYHYSAYT